MVISSGFRDDDGGMYIDSLLYSNRTREADQCRGQWEYTCHCRSSDPHQNISGCRNLFCTRNIFDSLTSMQHTCVDLRHVNPIENILHCIPTRITQVDPCSQ